MKSILKPGGKFLIKHKTLTLYLQHVILKTQNIFFLLKNSLYKGTKMAKTQELLDLIKGSLKRCAEPAMILGKLNNDLLTLRRESINSEYKLAYKHLSFPKIRHPKLTFVDYLQKSIKELT